jgi:hypothetical protein
MISDEDDNIAGGVEINTGRICENPKMFKHSK